MLAYCHANHCSRHGFSVLGLRTAALMAIAMALFILSGAIAGSARADGPPAGRDWPQLGGSPARNNVSAELRLPLDWQPGEFNQKTGKWLPETARNVRWMVPLDAGSWPPGMASGPAVSQGKVFVGSNNRHGYVKRLPKEKDLACLLCLRETDGALLWQFSNERLPTGRVQDWPLNALLSTAYVEGDRLWIVTNRDEVVCLDTEGFLDGQNDGPFQGEPNENKDEADVVWKFDLIKELGVSPHNLARSSMTAAGDVLFVGTSNGVDEGHVSLPAPDAPSFLAIDKNTGRLLWSDNSPGRRVMHGQWSSPAYAELAGGPQVVFAGGDGWLYSFLGTKTKDGRSQLLWKFDCNDTSADPLKLRRWDRNSVIGSAVICAGRVYAAVGEDPEHGEGPGCLWCLDPSKTGNASRLVDGRTNPQTAKIWKFESSDDNGNGKIEPQETLHRGIGTPVIHDGLVVIADSSGFVHCLDAKTGRHYWTHDLLAACYTTPLVAGGNIYVGDEDGDVIVFKLSPKKQIVAEKPLQFPLLGVPVAANGTLYILTSSCLFAIAKPGGGGLNPSD